jgi:hypothetical protein
MPPAVAGRRQIGGWLDSRGRFYPAGFGAHIRVAFLLRETGEGPADPWDMANTTWAMVKAHGEVIALPGRLAQPQFDSLGDMLVSAPDGAYRSHLLVSLRRIQQFEMCGR